MLARIARSMANIVRPPVQHDFPGDRVGGGGRFFISFENDPDQVEVTYQIKPKR
jgi:hypothetical protein